MRLAILKERRGHRPRLQPRVPAESSGCKAQPLRGGEYRRLNPFDRHLVHHDVDDRTVTRFARLGLPNLADDVHSFTDFSEHRMVSIEVRSGRSRDEELTAVVVGSSV